MDNVQWAMCNGQWAMGNEQWAWLGWRVSSEKQSVCQAAKLEKVICFALSKV